MEGRHELQCELVPAHPYAPESSEHGRQAGKVIVIRGASDGIGAAAAPGNADAEKGADTLTWLAQGSPGVEWESGQLYVKRKIAKTHVQALDEDLSACSWDVSARMVGLDAEG